MKFPNGTSVKVASKEAYSLNGRTGVVIDDALEFPWRDCRKVALDPKPDAANKPQVVFVVDLREIKASERPISAPPREQLALFGEASP